MTKFTTASGEVLTDDDVEALADEAERGYDLDKATRVTVGRPSPQCEGSLAARAGARRSRSREGSASACTQGASLD
jgi:hypothetical protein